MSPYFNDSDYADFDPKDGPYTVRVEGGDAFESKDGREFCKLELRVIDGGMADAKNRVFEHFMSLSHPEARRMSGDALGLYGVDLARVEDLDDLAEAITGLVGAEAEITVAHKNGYLNVTVHSTVPPGGEAGPPAEPPKPNRPAPTDEDDIPF